MRKLQYFCRSVMNVGTYRVPRSSPIAAFPPSMTQVATLFCYKVTLREKAQKCYVSHVKCDISHDTFPTCKVKRSARDVKSDKVGRWALIWDLREVAAPSPYSQEGRNASHIIIVIIILLPSCCDDLMIINKLTTCLCNQWLPNQMIFFIVIVVFWCCSYNPDDRDT